MWQHQRRPYEALAESCNGTGIIRVIKLIWKFTRIKRMQILMETTINYKCPQIEFNANTPKSHFKMMVSVYAGMKFKAITFVSRSYIQLWAAAVQLSLVKSFVYLLVLLWLRVKCVFIYFFNYTTFIKTRLSILNKYLLYNVISTDKTQRLLITLLPRCQTARSLTENRSYTTKPGDLIISQQIFRIKYKELLYNNHTCSSSFTFLM